MQEEVINITAKNINKRVRRMQERIGELGNRIQHREKLIKKLNDAQKADKLHTLLS